MNVEFMAAVLDVLCLAYAFWRRHRLPIGVSFPLIPGLLIAHLLLFALPAVLFRDGLLALSSSTALDRSALLVSGGLIALLAGHDLPLAAMLAAPLPILTVRWRVNPCRRALLWMALGLVALILQKAGQPPVVDGILTLLGFIGLWAMAALWLLYWRGQVKRLWIVLALMMLTLATFGMELVQGFLARPIIDAALLYTVYLRARGRIPYLALIVGGPLVFMLVAAKVAFRAALPQGEWQRAGIGEKIEFYGSALRLVWEFPFAQEVVQGLLLRVSDVGLLAVVLDESPRFVPYWAGHTYADLGWKLVPRLLDPQKPQEHTGAVFGHRYGILPDNDRQTSVNMTILIEGAANFGPAGALIAMALLGLMCRGLERLFDQAPAEDAAFALAAPVLASLFMVEDTFANTVGALCQHLPVLLIALELSGICSFGRGYPLGRGRPAMLVSVMRWRQTAAR